MCITIEEMCIKFKFSPFERKNMKRYNVVMIKPGQRKYGTGIENILD